MAVAGQYKPIGKSKTYRSRIPVEIVRCVDSEGNYILVKKYADYTGRGRKRRLIPDCTYEQEPCKLDMPAEFKLVPLISIYSGNKSIDTKPNPDYQVQMIKYYIDKQDCNEYELRNLIMSYLKSKRKEMDSDKFKSVCNIFDKADKMLSRADTRKNSNRYEADVSYKFLIRSYKKIVELCEGDKKKAVEKEEIKIDIVGSMDRFLISDFIQNKYIIKGGTYQLW